MRKALVFARRTGKEILRDPLTLFFGLGFPLILLVLLSLIQKNIPVPLFEIEKLTPGIMVFGLSFMTLFAGMIVAKDRESAFLQRLYTTPLRASDFIFGYILPMLPTAVVQSIICLICALAFGLKPSVNIIFAILGIIPVSLFFIALGLLCGSALGSKQVGGICGALVTNLTAWLSGVWFDLDLVKGLKTVADFLPFSHAVKFEQALLNGDFSAVLPHALWVGGYAAAVCVAAIFLFTKRMKEL